MRGKLINLALAVTIVALHGCGGGGSSSPPPAPSDDIVVASVTVNSGSVAPITRTFDAAGKYDLVLTGAFTAGTVSAPDGLAMRFSMSGQSQITGNGQPSIAITKTGQMASISQSIAVETTGQGPWSVQIQIATQATAVTVSDLRLHVAKVN